jgi:NAD-dependent dihydropyrimidine dehydrogenase PreA subunit
MNQLRAWLQSADAKERLQLAEDAKTTTGQLYQLAGGHRVAGPGLARKIELASAKLEREGLPKLKREELCPACGVCEFAKAGH